MRALDIQKRGIILGYHILMAMMVLGNLRMSAFDSAQNGGPVQNGKIVHFGKSYKKYVFVEQKKIRMGPQGCGERGPPFRRIKNDQTRFTRSMVKKPITDGTEKHNQT